jgi:hypothetical protein
MRKNSSKPGHSKRIIPPCRSVEGEVRGERAHMVRKTPSVYRRSLDRVDKDAQRRYVCELGD